MKRSPEVDAPKQVQIPPSYRADLGKGAELYLPSWFVAKNGGYDLIIHFHGESRWQQANVEHAKLNVAIVSVNLPGVGTKPYSNAFKAPEAFERLLAEAHTAIMKSGRADGANLRRLALSAWSAGFSSVARVMTERVTPRIDAVLLADGFFTHFTDPKKRTVNARGLEKFARFADAARRDEKLFVITHTTIPTGPYPSVQECVATLLEMVGTPKMTAVTEGLENAPQIYAVDQGSFHVRGFDGKRASDHVRQLHAMGETLYPWLKTRWERQDEDADRSGTTRGP